MLFYFLCVSHLDQVLRKLTAWGGLGVAYWVSDPSEARVFCSCRACAVEGLWHYTYDEMEFGFADADICVGIYVDFENVACRRVRAIESSGKNSFLALLGRGQVISVVFTNVML